jgi:predicted lipid-binding transport protein (Tim44 family)
MKRSTWPLTGLALGAVLGALWGWFGSGGYEAIDSAVGTGLMCALVGLLIGAVAAVVAGRRDRR